MTPIEQIKAWLDESRRVREMATPGPYHFDCGNGEVESRHAKHYRVAIAQRDDLVSRVEHCKDFDLGYNPPDFPVHPDADMEFIALTCTQDQLKDEIIEKLVKALVFSERNLDRIKFDLYASAYTLKDEEFEVVFDVRDNSYLVIKEVAEMVGKK